MGQLVDGVWHTHWYPSDAQGRFHRPQTQFHGRVERDAEPGRYRLYVSYACPWAHRTLIVRALRGLEHAIPVTVVDPHMGDDGWPFAKDDADPVTEGAFLRELYLRARPDYSGRVTVPVLWDLQRGTIVNNESREIMRMLDVELEHLATRGPSLAPAPLRGTIDEILTAIYEPINNGVYRTGFATKQRAYEEACRELFDALARWEKVLSAQRYLCGDQLTEADVALFTTLLRFDLVYYSHFKCNVRRIQDSEVLFAYLRDVYQTPGVRETCHLDQIKTHYYWSQNTINPSRVVPLGPAIDLDAPHGRG